ncbi:MAG: T9SS type A sorting domain-containing protein [Saprospiraceae bacterium]|nr:T9SS type A sorting domain-containing protein [Saprospiraceae bacterium]
MNWNNVLIYPNPSTDHITLETSQPCKIEIYDITGHKVLTIATNENSTDMDISPLHPGLYLIKCTTASGVASVQKFVKQ